MLIVYARFLLAQLHMDSLATKGTCKAVRKALEALPKGLDNTYDEAMERIEKQNKDDQELAKRVLYWICYALRPFINFGRASTCTSS